MKSGAIDSPKMKRLSRALGISRSHAAGIMECLWHFVSVQCPRGDIGRFQNEDIAEAVFWDGDANTLVDALVECRWLDKSEEFRLGIHDWADHADDAVNMRLARRRMTFWCGKVPNSKRLSKEERAKLSQPDDDFVRTESARRAHNIPRIPTNSHELPTLCAPPKPKPEPSPEPDIKSTSFESETSKPVRIVLDKRQWVYTGITDEDWKRWESAYPDVDLQREIAASIVWARDNPAKARKTNWGKFLSGWFSRTQGSTPKKQRAPDEFENTFDENHPMFDKVNQLLAEKAEQDAKAQGEIFGT